MEYNGNEIIVVIDEDNILWFYGKQIAKILEYKDPRRTINDIDNNFKTQYDNIKYYSKYKYNIQDHTIFINEAGLYDLTLRSKKKIAIEFKKWIVKTVTPTIRKNGKYELEKNNVEEINKLNDE